MQAQYQTADPQLLRQQEKYSQASLMIKQLMIDNKKSRHFLTLIKNESSSLMNALSSNLNSNPPDVVRRDHLQRKNLQEMINRNRETKKQELAMHKRTDMRPSTQSPIPSSPQKSDKQAFHYPKFTQD